MAGKSKFDFRITDEFDLELFWKQHGTKIIYAVVGVLAVGAIAYVWQQRAREQVEQVSSALATATDARALERIIAENPGNQTAAQALLRLADIHFHEGRYAEAATAYKKFADQYPQHPLIQSALLGQAATEEAQGNLDAAKSLYNKLITDYPQGYVAKPAKLGLARCAEARGQIKEARQLYEELMAATQGTPLQQEAYTRWMVLGRDLASQVVTQIPSPETSTEIVPPAISPQEPPSEPAGE